MDDSIPDPKPDLEATAALLDRLRHGDRAAGDRLVRRYLPSLKRFAHGRLPARLRRTLDTDDLVQVTLVRALEHIDTFEPRHEGAFLAYLRQILINHLRDEVRKVDRQPAAVELGEDRASEEQSPLEQAIGREGMLQYESALARLEPAQREAVILRLEFGFTYAQIVEALQDSSENAVRMKVTRAVMRMSKWMRQSGVERGGA